MSSGNFWETMNLLVGKEYRKTGKEVMDDVQDWVDKVIVKRELSVEEHQENPRSKTKAEKLDTSSLERVSENKDQDKEVEEFIKSIKLPKIQCTFSHPHVTSRLEKLMGSNLVSLTDRDYMQKLQQRILEDYAQCMDKRIKVREYKETERVKNLVLSGKIPLHEAPESMADHPIMTIEKYCKKLIAARRAKIKRLKVHIPTHLYFDDTPDPPSGLSIENGHIFRKPTENLCNPVSRFLPDDDYPPSEESEDEEEEEEGEEEEENQFKHENLEMLEEEEEEEEEENLDPFMFTRAEYNRLKYESPLVRQLRKCQTVEQLYELADEIIGVLKSLETPTGKVEDKDRSQASSVRSSMQSEVASIRSAPPSSIKSEEKPETASVTGSVTSERSKI